MSLVSAVDRSVLTAVPGGWDTGDSRDGPRFDKTRAARGVLDETSRSWVEQLQVGHPRHHETVAGLHLMMGKIAVRELARRQRQLPALTGPEFEDLAQQAADDALVKVLNRLDSFRGLSRFTTWVYKFVICEVSTKVVGHAWHRQPPSLSEEVWEQLSAPSRCGPEETLERRAQLRALREAIGELTERQRRVFVSIALNDVPIDVVALELGTNRNAIYKNLFDARQSLRARMAAAGHPVSQRGPCERRAGGRLARDVEPLRCVIVDDNRALLKGASRLLERQGISVVGVATATRDAISLIEELKPDVILVDIVLGPESGFDLVRRIAAPGEAGCSRTILISTHDEDDFADVIAASPAVGFVRKAHLSAASIRRLLANGERLFG